MDPAKVRELLEQLRSGDVDVEHALDRLRGLPFADLGYARVDHHRALRQGVPEVVLGQGKTAPQISGIARELIRTDQNVLITRLDPATAAAVLSDVPELDYQESARVATYRARPEATLFEPPIPVLTAGTSDLAVAEEAVVTLEMCGIGARRLFDVGVAGIHRLMGEVDELRHAPALIVVAGMEGALASVVGGLVPSPVVAVPTSVGYGASFGGVAALLGMLSSCASGVTVVNIDNGFGAAMAVVRILADRRGMSPS